MSKFGEKLYRYISVSSTNDLAKAEARKGEPEGTVILAEEQTQGRGKWDRCWISPRGEGIWMSIILRPRLTPQEASQITILSAVAVVKALRNYLKLPAKIKWPNDIIINGRKIAGILTEMEEEKGKIKFVIVGIGLNTNLDLNKLPEERRNEVTSIKQELNQPFSQEKLIEEIIKEMEFFYELFNREGFSVIRENWKDYSDTLGRSVEVNFCGEKVFGQALGLTETGALLLRRESEIIEEITGSDIQTI